VGNKSNSELKERIKGELQIINALIVVVMITCNQGMAGCLVVMFMHKIAIIMSMQTV